MKPYILFGLIILSTIGISSCKKTKIAKGNITVDSMQLQYFPGYSPEPDRNYYRIAGGVVKEDTTSEFNNQSPNQFDKILSADKYNEVKHLLNEVPAQLLKENNTYYTSNAVVDAGGITVRAYYQGTTYTWYFYAYTDDMPDYVKTFADKAFDGVHTLNAK